MTKSDKSFPKGKISQDFGVIWGVSTPEHSIP